MNLRILNYFLTVVREKNITKAAEILHITQPTLSRQLIQLETELGVKLFDRDKHKFALTPSGQFLVERAREILNMVEKTTLDIQEQEQNLAGSIAMGAGEYQATEVLAKLIGGFQKQYAAVSFELFTSSADLLHDKLDKGLLDVAILQAPVDTTNYDHLRLHRALTGAKGKFLLSYNDCPEIRGLYAGCEFFDFTRLHSMVQRYEVGREFPELLVANYDLYEREKAKPDQLTLFEEKSWKERILT